MATSVLWFRRDLRLADNPALLEASRSADEVVALFVLDPQLLRRAGGPRLTFLYRTLAELDLATNGSLVLRTGDPAEVVPAVAREVDAGAVFAGADYGPYALARDEQVEMALGWAGVGMHWIGSPYAVPPGELLTIDGSPYDGFAAYQRAWLARGASAPLRRTPRPGWVEGLDTERVPAAPEITAALPSAGENAAAVRLEGFLANQLEGYAQRRLHPANDGTSRLSAYFSLGTLHPRQLLARLSDDDDSEALRAAVAQRDYAADVLFHRPEAVTEALRPEIEALQTDDGPEADERFSAWVDGRTGYPLVDAGMRQLEAEGWLPDRVRESVASFLVKDLHLYWRWGAQLFLERLVDAELATSVAGWQRVIGAGPDATPFYRAVNPSVQGRKLDPAGHYVRTWLPELGTVADEFVHEPWRAPRPPKDYPAPIVDHAVERQVTLTRYQEARAAVGA